MIEEIKYAKMLIAATGMRQTTLSAIAGMRQCDLSKILNAEKIVPKIIAIAEAEFKKKFGVEELSNLKTRNKPVECLEPQEAQA
jgi:hypothetical protein